MAPIPQRNLVLSGGDFVPDRSFGLKLETISRAFSHFQSEGLVLVKNKSIEIKDLDRLRTLVGQCAGA